MVKAAAKADTQDTYDEGSDDELTVNGVLCNFRKAFEAQELYLEAAKEDIMFLLGKQWDPEDERALFEANVRPLTINQIAPIVRLLKGIESQNRSDLRAMPEGDEDSVPAEIVSRLMKHVSDKSDLDFVCSETFESGNGSGRANIEPWIDYPMKANAKGDVDMNGRLRFKMRHHNVYFEDPASVEFDHDDAAYSCKWTPDLSIDQLKNLFPKMRDKLDEVASGRIKIDEIPMELDGTGMTIQSKGYNEPGQGVRPSWKPKNPFDLIDYYYRKWTDKFYVVDAKNGAHKLMPDEATAKRYVAAATKNEPDGQKSARVRMVPQSEIWVAFVTGGLDEFLWHGPAWSFPRWESYPVFSYYAYKWSFPVDPEDRGLLIQGIVRGAKDSQRELNKRRTQELRHMNQSTNSGWIVEEGAMTPEQMKHLKKFGGSPGVIVRYQSGKTAPARIQPSALSQGHAQMAQEHRQDLRDTVGLNTETLAVESDQSSGRAITARVRQGMVQVQGLFDNYARMRRNIGRFIIAMLPKLFDVEKVMRVIGESYLQQNFQSPIVDPKTQQPMIDPRTGAPATQYDQKLAQQTITKILQDAEIGVYDVAVGEIVAATTAMMGQFQEAMDLREKGIMVPDQVLLETSSLSSSAKKQTMAAAAAAAQSGQQRQPTKKAA